MPQLRRDPVIGRWVIVSTERAKRPNDFARPKEEPPDDRCPFCEGRESETPAEIFALREGEPTPNSPGWQVRVVPSIAPVLKIGTYINRYGRGLYDAMSGLGAHEIIIESPQHIPNMADLSTEQIEKALSATKERIVDLDNDPLFKYTLYFKNYGKAAGASSIRHSHSQLIALPVNPKRVKEELRGAKRYFDYKERCIFCDIISQETGTKERIVFESDNFLAFCPFASRFPFETWILPKKHSADFDKIEESIIIDLARALKATLMKLKRVLNDPPYNYILHTAPYRTPKRGHWRTIDEDFHWHFEIMPRLSGVAGFEWGSGFYINSIPPEEAAKYLRKTKVQL